MAKRIVLVAALAGCHGAADAPSPAPPVASVKRAAPARIRCVAPLNTHKGTSYQLDLRKVAGGYDLAFEHSNGLGCRFHGVLAGMTCVFHDAQPLAFACTRHVPVDPERPSVEDASFELAAYQRVDAGRSVSGQRITARLSRSPSLTDSPVECSQAGMDPSGTVIQIELDAAGCVLEPGVVLAAQ